MDSYDCVYWDFAGMFALVSFPLPYCDGLIPNVPPQSPRPQNRVWSGPASSWPDDNCVADTAILKLLLGSDPDDLPTMGTLAIGIRKV
jgi:hypothetical protein